jgi:ribonuclease PH
MGTRHDGRANDELRNFQLELDFTEMALSSVLVSMGRTRVICTVSLDERVPAWLRGRGSGWLSAEYAMLPAATPERNQREAVKGKQSGRTVEIQRLIGRSLRSMLDLEALGELQLLVDCDVIQADGGTRTASITGGAIALARAIERLEAQGKVGPGCLHSRVAAISVGIVDGEVLLDLDYSEDSIAEVDLNLVMTDRAEYIEIQGTAEGRAFSKNQLVDMLKVGEAGIRRILDRWPS